MLYIYACPHPRSAYSPLRHSTHLGFVFGDNESCVVPSTFSGGGPHTMRPDKIDDRAPRRQAGMQWAAA